MNERSPLGSPALVACLVSGFAPTRSLLMAPLLASLLLLYQAVGGCGPPPVVAADPAPATSPRTKAQPAAPAVSAEVGEAAARGVDELLVRLERSDEDLRDFQAQIGYFKWDNVLERLERRYGEIIYQVRADGSKRFAILLERLIVGNRARQQRRHYVFDGSWLVEINHDAKHFIKRQIVPPGQTFDPLKLGEGPFPLPVGQPKEEVLARFHVELLAEPDNDLLKEQLADREVEGLRLVPKPKTPEAENVQSVELFFDADTLLPVGISLIETNGDRKTVILRDLRRNAGVDESKLSIEEPDPRQWQIDVRPWRGK